MGQVSATFTAGRLQRTTRAPLRLVFFITAILTGGCGGGGGDSAPSPSNPPDQAPVPSFNQAGGFNGAVRSMLPVPDGSGDIYVSGDFTAYGGQPVAHVVRVRPEGTLHQGFTLSGTITNPISSMAAADDGSGAVFVAEQVGGFPVSIGRIWKLTPQGAVTEVFTVGTAEVDAQNEPFFGAVIRSLVPVGDGSGRIYAAVSGQYNGTAAGPIIRLNPDGSLDPTFQAQTGVVFRIVPAQDGSGDLYIASWLRHSPSGFAANLSRLNPEGTRDSNFQAPGHWPEALWESANVSLMVPVGDGSRDLLAVGFFPNLAAPQPIEGAYRGLVRMNPDGTMDLASPRPQVNPDESVVALVKAIDGSGDWLVGQNFEQTQSRVLRFRSDGAVNPTFTTGQIVGNALFNQPRGVPPYLFLPAPDATGDVYIGGEFSSYNGVTVGNIVRITGNGMLD